MKRDYGLYIEDILEACNRIENYIGDMSFDDFSGDLKTVDAIIRNLEIIGEAAKHIPVEMRETYPC